eukprot:CAMPEP_0178426056 /NCGR_PEP_ID=MMETSP0689_2-20121128/29040_1 /TAXON_ID=160604 /ORGANISM="Amphidinium massartii, Strain CS-259" /LENGTH=510 /DNA_ID=CAMNT_0020047735 /DNA_START=123 /DNA_END=1655 /DNA_ORIENTATION=+
MNPHRFDPIPPSRFARFFPLEPFRCCPAAIRFSLPNTWTRVQDFTHLTLIVGCIAGVLLTIEAVGRIVLIALGKASCRKYCVQEIVKCVAVVVFMLPSIAIFFQIINRYDEQLQVKQREIAMRKEQLTSSLKDTIQELNGFVNKLGQTSAGLAEANFQSKYRDFLKFLAQVKNRYNGYFTDNPAELAEFKEQFKVFILRWMDAWKERSLNPLELPNQVISREMLDACDGVGEICDLVVDHLKTNKVKFITEMTEQESREVRKTCVNARRMTQMPARHIPAGQSIFGQQLTWLQFGASGCACRSTDGDFPRQYCLGCMRITVLSENHFKLLVCGVVAIALLIAEAVLGSPLATIGFLCNLFCTCVVLLHFEQLDVIEQLKSELKAMEATKKQAEEKKKDIKKNYEQVEKLTDMWLHRTVPRMDLMKEIHDHLRDTEETCLLKDIQRANQAIGDLENSLGPLSNWTDRVITQDAMKKIGQDISVCAKADSFDQVIEKLDALKKKGPLAVTNA